MVNAVSSPVAVIVAFVNVKVKVCPPPMTSPGSLSSVNAVSDVTACAGAATPIKPATTRTTRPRRTPKREGARRDKCCIRTSERKTEVCTKGQPYTVGVGSAEPLWRVIAARPLHAGDRCEPGLSVAILHVGFDHRGFDRVDAPAVGERASDLLPGDATGTGHAGLFVAETEHEVPPARRDRRSQVVDVDHAVVVVEHVEHATVEHGVPLLAEARELEHVAGDESNIDALLAPLRLRL